MFLFSKLYLSQLHEHTQTHTPICIVFFLVNCRLLFTGLVSINIYNGEFLVVHTAIYTPNAIQSDTYQLTHTHTPTTPLFGSKRRVFSVHYKMCE